MVNLDKLDLITETVKGYRVKDLRVGNKFRLITGMVQDPKRQMRSRCDGWIGHAWYLNGDPYPCTMDSCKTHKKRKDLKLNLDVLN